MSNNKSLSNINRTFNKLNKEMEQCVNNDIVSNIIIVLLIAYSILIAPSMSYEVASIFDNFLARISLMAVIVVMCLYDPIKALLMAIAFVISIQRLYKLKKSNSVSEEVASNVSRNVPSAIHSSGISSTPTVVSEDKDLTANNLDDIVSINNRPVVPTVQAPSIGDLLDDEGMSGISQNKEVEQFSNPAEEESNLISYNQPTNDIANIDNIANINNNSNNVVIQEDSNQLDLDAVHPAFQTLTENIRNDGARFTSEQQLKDVQSNRIESCDYNDQQKTFAQQHGTQGLDHPTGVKESMSLLDQSSAF